jgi:hypothetical protein
MNVRGIFPSLGAGGSLIAAVLCAAAVFGGALAFRGGGTGTAEANAGDVTVPSRTVRAPTTSSRLARTVLSLAAVGRQTATRTPTRPRARARTRTRPQRTSTTPRPTLTPTTPPATSAPTDTPVTPAGNNAPPLTEQATGAVQRTVQQVRQVAQPVIEQVPRPAQQHAESVTETVQQVAGTVDQTVDAVTGGLLP